mgnify:CR=1 FL=1
MVIDTIVREVDKLINVGLRSYSTLPGWPISFQSKIKMARERSACVNYRDLNKARPKDDFPLPNIDILTHRQGFEKFSFIDGYRGYNQSWTAPEDAKKTAFRTPKGNFYNKVMPFELKNAGATYQRAMTTIFQDMAHKEIEDYVDDIVVKSGKGENHISVLDRVFERCRANKMKMNPLKCAFGVSAGIFLGFVVHRNGIEPSKIKAILETPPPTTLKELKSLMGKISYIR